MVEVQLPQGCQSEIGLEQGKKRSELVLAQSKEVKVEL